MTFPVSMLCLPRPGIDEGGAEIATAGWLPGSDCIGTPFEPIYTKVARGDFDRSATFLGHSSGPPS